MRSTGKQTSSASRPSLYQEITDKIVAQIEAGALPWVHPWAGGAVLSLPKNASTTRGYSGVNILLLWDALFTHGYDRNLWLTFKQALALGASVRKGERGATCVYADRFIPKREADAASNDEDARSVPFLKRFTLFNVAQCDGLAPELVAPVAPVSRLEPIAAAEELLIASGASIARGGEQAFYHPASDSIRIPEQNQFFAPVNFYRTALHELTHWSGAKHRLNRDFTGRFGSEAYAREELVAEIGSAFLCASLGITPTVRHADYIATWLTVLKNDARAIVSAASHASKASDFLLAFTAQATRAA
ncbi:MAG: antirepressor [Rhodospirillales bacterium 69-11]|nr:MAG: antirepressor [Rhodospirillales bacterium 69-11]